MHTPLFLRLPQELHVLVSNNLKEDGSLKALSALSRTSRSLRSSYEPALYLALVREKGDNSLPACDYALMWGARHGSIPVMAQAKAYGADHDKQVKHANGRLGWRHPVRRTCLDSCYGWASALQTAVHNGHVDAVQWLLDQGANVDAGGAENPAVDICRCCNMSDPPSEGRRSIVHLAVCAGHVSTLRVLLERGASLEVAEQIDGEHILHAVLMSELDTYRKDNKQEPLAMLKVVLDHLAQGTTSESARSSALNSVGKRQLTLLQFTIDFFHLEHMREVFALLVRAGASLGPLPSTAEWTGGSPCVSFLLYTLKRYGICNAFYKALDLGAEINGNRPDPVNAHPRWQSPLHFLVRHAEQEPLLQESRLYEGDPSLLYEHEGRGRRHREHVAELLRRGAFLDIQDAEGRTPLGNAMSYGSEHISLNRRLWALKMVKVMLKNAVQGHPVLENGVSEESVAKAKEWMEEVVRSFRAEKATVVERARGPEHSELRPGPDPWGRGFIVQRGSWEGRKRILLKWTGWERNGGRLVRARQYSPEPEPEMPSYEVSEELLQLYMEDSCFVGRDLATLSDDDL